MKKTAYLISIILGVFLFSCSEDEIRTIGEDYSSLNILKGTFNAVEYPDSSSFNAYFLGVGADDYLLQIPIRVSGKVDLQNDRKYNVKATSENSVTMTNGHEFSISEEQIIRKGLLQDSIQLTIHVGELNTKDFYRLRIELLANDEFENGIPEYQFYIVSFYKNLNVAPPFWNNNNNLKKYTYHPEKCAVFLEISKITDPDWVDGGTSIMLNYWVEKSIKWFRENIVLDEDGNRIYFDDNSSWQ